MLYVDDEWTNQVVFDKTFGKSYRVKTLGSGEEALELMKGEPVGVLVTDQRMPGMSGNELLRQVKELYPQTIRVVVTAYSDMDPILRAVNDGLVARYVVKPWVRSEFEQVLAWSVEAHLQVREQSALHARLMSAERLITIGGITSAVFHDLKGAINHVCNNSERLAQLAACAPALLELLGKHGASIPEPHRTNLADLAEEIDEISRDLVTGSNFIAELSRAMQRILSPKPDDPTEAAPRAVIEFALKIYDKVGSHVERRYEGPPVLPKVRLSESELMQVFINLVSNAMQALPARPVTGGTIVVSAIEEPAAIRFTVADNGPGMTADVLHSAGSLYFTTRTDGAGLGLSTCKRLIEGHQGSLTLDSAPGRGTRVSFTIPKA